MDTNNLETLENNINQLSQEFLYPATPDISGAVAQRLAGEAANAKRSRQRLAWAAVTILLIGALMAVPPVRAQILEFLQIGAVRIFLTEPTPAATNEDVPLVGEPVRMVPTATPHTYPSITSLAGKTSLTEAQSQVDFSIRLPAYPPDLGKPDYVFLQDLGGQAVLLVWMDPDELDSIRIDLLLMGPGTFAEKGQVAVIEETAVNGQPAVWTQGPHFLHLGGSRYQNVPLVTAGNILVWEQDGITYRLESDLTLEEAVKVAESLE